MFKNIFKLEKSSRSIDWFHKKYIVFDSCDIVFFDTKIEALAWIRIRNSALESSFYKLMGIYKTLNSHYVDRLFKRSSNNWDVCYYNEKLRDCLEAFDYISRSRYAGYHLQKLKYLSTTLLDISNKFGYTLLEKQIVNIRKTIYYDYPVYNSNNKPIINKNIAQSIDCALVV